MQNLDSSIKHVQRVPAALDCCRGVTDTTGRKDAVEYVWDLQSETSWASAHDYGGRADLVLEVLALSPECSVLELVHVVHVENS